MKKKKTALGWVRSICLLFAVVFSLSLAVDIPYVTTMEVQAASTTYTKKQAKSKAKTILKDKVKVKSSDSAKTKLKKIFKYTEKKWSYSRDYDKVTKSTWPTYAYEMMKGKKGGCYHWAAGFAVLARQALGSSSKYKVRIAVGKTKGFGNDSQAHAWVEIKIKSTWYIFDPEMDKMMEDSSRKYFYVKRSKSSIKKTYCSYKNDKHYTVSF